MRFQNPQNGHIETVGTPWLWSLILGFFYFAAKGIWTHAIVGLVLGVLTIGLSWLIYPFFASGIVRAHYLRNGWTDLDGEPGDELADARDRIMRRGREREKSLKNQGRVESDLDALLERAGKRLLEKQRKEKSGSEEDAQG